MKRTALITALLLALCFGGALQAHAQQETVIKQGEPTEIELTASELADKILEYAATFLGTPYRYGANGPKRFDCTGYTRYVFNHFGYFNLDRSAKDQARNGREVDISDFHNLQKGDILLLGSRLNPKVVGHVGIFTGLDTARNDPKFIHASNHGVRYSSIYTESYYANRLLGARRILPDFEDYKVEFDTTAVYAFEPDHGVHIAPDSLVLADADRRIVLFENGKWAYVDADGTLIIPEGGGRLILTGDGNWAPVREVKVTIPTTALKPDPRDLEPDPTPATTSKATTAASTTNQAKKSAASKDTTKTNTSAGTTQGEQIYHTIVKGDTLSKIARQHGTTVNALCQLNNISPNTILKVGRKLRVK